MTENEETPTAMTGVVRPEPSPLAELSSLLGVEVVDVERHDGAKYRSWHLTVKRGEGEHRRTQRLPALRTADLENATQMNWITWQCGRDLNLPPLTRADGMRALRMLHAYVEASGRVTDTNKNRVIYEAALRHIVEGLRIVSTEKGKDENRDPMDRLADGLFIGIGPDPDAEKMIRLENLTATPAMAKLGGWVAQQVEEALAPALEGKRKYSCLHILDDITKKWSIPFGEEVGLVGRKPLLCPFHPERLLCNRLTCMEQHLYEKHPREHEAACFVCEEPIVDPITRELRGDFEGVTAVIQLHQQVPFYDDNRRQDQWYVYRGELVTMPMAYLCPRHAGLLELPVRMAWPTVMRDVG